MWIKGKHVVIDNQGRRVTRDITLNMNQAIGYIALDEERTRLFFCVGHDVEDHRNASWVDIDEPKSKVDRFLGKPRKPVLPLNAEEGGGHDEE